MKISEKAALLKRWAYIAIGKNRVAIKQGAGKRYSKTEIGGYYNDLTGKVNEKTLLDPDGIPVNVIAGGKTVYFPISVFQYALGLWDLYLLSGDSGKKEHFLKLCGWIVRKQSADGSWDCFGPLGCERFRVSSMGQGEAASVLVRAWKLTGKENWLLAARKAVSFMLTEVGDGGTLLLENGDTILEEYAGTCREKRSVLNGWIFSLFGLIDYLKAEENGQVMGILRDSLSSLKRNLNRYDCGYWSRYDRSGRIASPAYHSLHIALLRVLGDLTGEKLFCEYARKWEKYQKNPFYCIRAVGEKIVQKLTDSTEGVIIR